MNSGGPVAKIIERNGWKSKMDFVGHRKAVTCVVSDILEDVLMILGCKFPVKKVSGTTSFVR